MGRTIVVTSGKGGVGKTTCTANLGVALAMQGHSVAVVDADIGLRNLDVILGMEDRITYTLVDAIEGRCRLKQALIRDKRYPKLSLLAAAQVKDKTSVSPNQMKKLAAELSESFEYVLIDCPAGIERGFQNAVAGAREALVVTTPEVSAVRDADRIIGILKEVGMGQIKLIVNRVRPQMIRRKEMMSVSDVIDILGVDLIGIVPEEADIVIASNRGEPVAASPGTQAGTAYGNVARRMAGEEVPFPDFIKKESVFTRIAALFGAGN